MLERRQIRNNKSEPEFRFKQYKTAGQEHYLIVKKKVEAPMNTEDIFCDWRNNLVDSFEKRRQAALAARKQRSRKFSNRALRKELLKEIDAEEKQKPKSYSDMLKKNLKVPMEDIFEAWRDYLQELDEIVRSDSRTSFSKDEAVEDILDSAGSYQTELQHCGQPTVKSASLKKKCFEKEVIFASCRHNFNSQDDNQEFVPSKKLWYQPENYFASWKFNLDENLSNNNDYDDYEPEMTFYDWIQNLEESKIMRSESNKMLKNKQRKERKSKKNNKH